MSHAIDTSPPLANTAGAIVAASAHAGRLRVALIFPNTYFVGMSNLGFQGVHAHFNSFEEIEDMDPEARKDYIWQMQQIMYEQTPWVVVAYPDFFEAYDTRDWTGWTRATPCMVA